MTLRKQKKLLAPLTLVLLCPGAWAQSGPDTSRLTGLLIDPTDRPVPGVVVTIAGDGPPRKAQTSATGEFQVDDLPQGRYRLSATVPGFVPLERSVQVGRRPVRVLLKLALARLDQEITVAGQPLSVNAEAGGNLNVISVERGMMDNLPVLGMDYLSALSRFLDPGTPGGAGVSLIVDGMEARNVGVTPSAIQEIRINQNPYTAEYPRWSRRRIEVITKSAADRHHGTLTFLFRDYRLDARNALALQRPPEQRRIFEGSLFSPWGRSKNTSCLLSAMRESEDLVSVVYAQVLSGPRIENAPTPQQNTVASLRISRQQSDRNAMFWQVNFQDRWQNNIGVGGHRSPGGRRAEPFPRGRVHLQSPPRHRAQIAQPVPHSAGPLLGSYAKQSEPAPDGRQRRFHRRRRPGRRPSDRGPHIHHLAPHANSRPAHAEIRVQRPGLEPPRFA